MLIFSRILDSNNIYRWILVSILGRYLINIVHINKRFVKIYFFSASGRLGAHLGPPSRVQARVPQVPAHLHHIRARESEEKPGRGDLIAGSGANSRPWPLPGPVSNVHACNSSSVFLPDFSLDSIKPVLACELTLCRCLYTRLCLIYRLILSRESHCDRLRY